MPILRLWEEEDDMVELRKGRDSFRKKTVSEDLLCSIRETAYLMLLYHLPYTFMPI